jgi:hypothetical protein
VADGIILVVCPNVSPETGKETLAACNVVFRFPAEIKAMPGLAMQV